MFFSSAGILDGAIYNQNLLLVAAERRMMEQSQQVVLLADSDNSASRPWCGCATYRKSIRSSATRNSPRNIAGPVKTPDAN